MIKSIPNLLTLSNLCCGLLGIMYVFENRPEVAFWLIVLAGIFDFLDGFAARLLNVSGELGKQLDSLADLVTFGVLPGLICYYFMNLEGYCSSDGFCINMYFWLALPLAGAWRLAKFNIDTRQTNGFLGVPIPISGLTAASVALSIYYKTPWADFYTNFWVLKSTPLILAFFMVSEFPMLSLKFKKGDFMNIWRYVFLLSALLLLVFLHLDAMPPIYLAYVLVSFIANFALKNKTNG